MKWVGVLPWTYRPYYEACVATMHADFKKNVLFIDNEGDKNIGIMAAHNKGIDYMKEQGADWLIIISAAVRFGPTGGVDFIKVLENHPGYYVIHAASENVKGGKQQEGGGGHNEVFGWHLSAFHREVFENIGRWDENFTPYGFDDIDLSIRIQHHYKGKPGWDTFPIDVHDTTMGHSINLAGVKSPSGPLMEYFERKWGRPPGAWQSEEYSLPFNDPNSTLAQWPDAPNGGKWND